MAESQVPYLYDDNAIGALKASLSADRFKTYLQKANNNEVFAFALYLHNARLAKSFLFPLSIAEITLRNTVDHVLVQQYGTDWHINGPFRDHDITPESKAALDKAISRARSNNRGKVIAELTFDFWSNLFRTEYSNFWRTKANIAFPNLRRGQGRHEIQSLAREINRLRNRVAHHEPILDLNIPDLHSKIIKLVNLRCTKTSDWMKHHSNVSLVMRSRPNRAGSAPITLASRADNTFLNVEKSQTLFALTQIMFEQNYSAFICVENNQIIGELYTKVTIIIL